MSSEFKCIALIGRYQSPEIALAIGDLTSYLRDAGCEVMIEEDTAASIGDQARAGAPAVNYEIIGARADLAVVVGGDGTLLNTARRLAASGVPLVGVNQGRLGFMTDISRGTMRDGMGAVLAGRYTREQRAMLEASVERGDQIVFRNAALNDVVVNKGEIGRMIELSVHVDGEFLHVLRADGLIVATPTGSTAYALSANGPILHPAVAGIAVVPLCPHALSNRPITVSDSSIIEIRLLPSYDALIHFDGQTRFDARAGDVVRLTRSANVATLLHPPGYSYFAMLREKLHWSSAPRA